MREAPGVRSPGASCGDSPGGWRISWSGGSCSRPRPERSSSTSAISTAIDAAVKASAGAESADDDKVERLRALLSDGTPSLIFTSSRDTVRYLRDRLAALPMAWCTGSRAGLGHSLLPRCTVLGWFREGPGSPLPRPERACHLLVTDVAAEGLDLQRAARVVHYDLPWTPMRLEQREGRAIRLGSTHSTVSVVRFAPPAPIERALRLEHTLARKAALPSRAGLGPGGRSLWRWRADLAEMLGGGAAQAGTAVVPRDPPGVLGAFSLHAITAGREIRLAGSVVWVSPDGSWTEDEATIAARLAAAIDCRDPSRPSAARVDGALASAGGADPRPAGGLPGRPVGDAAAGAAGPGGGDAHPSRDPCGGPAAGRRRVRSTRARARLRCGEDTRPARRCCSSDSPRLGDAEFGRDSRAARSVTPMDRHRGAAGWPAALGRIPEPDG